jgi:hypothetical protein
MAFQAERQYIPQFSQDLLGYSVSVNGALADPDDNLVTINFLRESDSHQIFSRAAERYAVGQYQTTLSSVESADPGNYRVRFDYSVAGIAQVFEGLVLIGKASPSYDSLPAEFKGVVDQVWSWFEDLFDSPEGGPHLQTYFQAKFDRGRVAQRMRTALGRLNTVSQPFQSYTLDPSEGAVFPVATWGALLERATAIEVIKHLRRSYVEQPMFMGGNVTRLDRRDYLERWGEILEDEEKALKGQLDTFKISGMNMGRPAVLVSGGVYGRFSPTRYAGSAAARGIFFGRYY